MGLLVSFPLTIHVVGGYTFGTYLTIYEYNDDDLDMRFEGASKRLTKNRHISESNVRSFVRVLVPSSR